jgi:acyl carrier protein
MVIPRARKGTGNRRFGPVNREVILVKFQRENEMDREEIRRVVKGLIGKVADLTPEEIADNASFRDDLELDSLAMIEIGVHVEHAYKLRLNEDEMGSLGSVEDAVNLVIKKQAEQNPIVSGS